MTRRRIARRRRQTPAQPRPTRSRYGSYMAYLDAITLWTAKNFDPIAALTATLDEEPQTAEDAVERAVYDQRMWYAAQSMAPDPAVLKLVAARARAAFLASRGEAD